MKLALAAVLALLLAAAAAAVVLDWLLHAEHGPAGIGDPDNLVMEGNAA